ncbi:hypothetical protein ACJIZ3_008231 [Penstemon smallii]|uniref:EamA domain-containing protein n=1 Tax=Penstemon smallii TaxID=265156 RepID=A0ABD3T954_9LAMI
MVSDYAKKAKIYVAVLLLQFGFAGFAIVAKFALNKGTSHFTFAVYRNAIAAIVFAPFALVLERKIRPKMTFNIFFKIVLLGLLDPVIGQNLFYAGMNETTATITSAMSNLLPALTFIIALVLSQSKILGTLVTVGGAMIMTLVAGPIIGLPWTNDHSNDSSSPTPTQGQQKPVLGALMIAAGNFGYALFYVLQAITLKSYPAGLSLITLVCSCGALQGTVLTFIVERGNIGIWSIGWNATLLAYAYGGIISSAVTYYVSGLIMKEKGPVFVTAFNPLSMIIVAVMSSFIFAEQLDVGKITGGVVIVIGLYLVIWGKTEDEYGSFIDGSELPVHQQPTLTNIPSKKELKANDVQLSQPTSVNATVFPLINMESKLVNQVKVYGGVILLQFGFAGFGIVAKFALNKGTSHYTFSVYRNAIAALVFAPFAFVLERKTRPKMTLKIFFKIMLLGFLDPVLGQNLFYAGMNETTVTFTSAMCNVLPALTFLMAWILRVERVNIKKIHSQAKIIGTMVTVSGAMIMTLIVGPEIGLPWTKNQPHKIITSTNHAPQHPIKGALMIAAGNIAYSLFYILQANTLMKSYPAGLSLTTLICSTGALEGVVLTFMVERSNLAIWSIGWDAKLLAYAYGGLISSGLTYYVSGIIMKERGPVFVTAFNPLNMIIIAVMSSFIFADQLDVGKVTGAIVVVIGLYLVIWGKSKDRNNESFAEKTELPIKSTADGNNKLSMDKELEN